MSLAYQINEWSAKHHPKWLVILRVALGLCLFIKGFDFIRNSVELTSLFSATSIFVKATWINTIIPWLNLLGGTMLIIGLFTRLWTVILIPVLLGAVFFVNTGVFAAGSDVMLPIIILALLIFFLFEGGGPISLDNYFKHYRSINREN